MPGNKKGVQKGYPLIIQATAMKYEESPFDKDFVSAMIPKLEYEERLATMPELPSSLPSNHGVPSQCLGPKTAEKQLLGKFEGESQFFHQRVFEIESRDCLWLTVVVELAVGPCPLLLRRNQTVETFA
ncbi:hypothetical protein AK812_SmicGene14549 [Symbiodinium microadriaticum]|uniref:Uncharacterized protein n=1 Tax=Symbiodinium microadriaticum TaxID=2951 RepID=A0A1Q9E5A2_SYMMI|nr:hypothetical protein AK812_SmicGene14549 [Symbiodinium microadriaticum]